MPTLDDAVRQLARHRAVLARAEADMRAAREAWEAENAADIAALAQMREFVQIDESIVRDEALAAYESDGNKHPHPAVTVKEITGLEYDQKDAQAWALEHHLALSFDKRVFERIAKASPPLFVTVTTTPRADIATDIDKALP